MDNSYGKAKELASFLIKHYTEQLHSIILSPDPRLHYPLLVDFAELLDDNPTLAHLLFSHPAEYLLVFDEAAIWAQKVIFKDLKQWDNASVKDYVHVRINVSGSPLECPETFPSIGRVRVKHRGILLTLKGTVIRSGAIKMIEGEKIYECRNCKHRFKVYPEVETRNVIPKPTICPSQSSKFCESTRFNLIEDNKICHDYQEIKIQENAQVLGVGAIPRSIPVILKDDLVDTVKAGDDVIVTGVLTAKWSPDVKDVRCDLDPVLVANYVRRMNEVKSGIDIPDDVIMKFKQFWLDFENAPLKGRNAILRGICPQVFGLFTVKLAVALTLIGGVQHVDASGTKVRGESHLLLVGDPGTGKSQFLKFAAKLSNRSVITTGLGSTSAGLTVTAVKDGGEWMLEAGALVLADGGLCCIDEFDRLVLLQLSVQGQLSLVQQIQRDSMILMNPNLALSVNTTLSGPLLSRFDIVLVLLDKKNPEWDAVVSSHILAEGEKENDNCNEDLTSTWPFPMLRRYIHFVKRNVRPVLSKEAENVISRYFQLQRRSATQNAARTTVRMLESLIRLAQAHARLMFRNEVTRLDAITAILCIESSMTTSAIVDSVGNALHSNFAENPDEEYAKQEMLILQKLCIIDEFPALKSNHQ
ncbi:probable DNA helicase MCM9 isoform X4 [Coffea arabica]|uniref:DNA helicase n=1 Tax=Coffea arabica TaxID=13443 RepID=A0ABM4WH31_COFAR